jgi:polysaccharide export outer membrane protein
MAPHPRLRPALSFLASLALASATSGCGSFFNWMPSSGALRSQVEDAKGDNQPEGVVIVDVNQAVTKRIVQAKKPRPFSESLASDANAAFRLSPGDVVEVTVWEAPPAMLFAGAVVDPRLGASTSRGMSFPEQVIADDGTINVPFAGRVEAKGLLPAEVEAEVARRLKGKANQAQVLVRTVRNNTSSVTIVGEVNGSHRMALSPRGERVLDAIAAAGGVKAPIPRVTVQLTRGNDVHSLPLDTIIREPQQNVILKPGDVVTAVFQNQSFTVLGAAGRNEEVAFEATGISLAQALARAGGLQDMRADAQGVFLFRFEDAKVFEGHADVKANAEGKVPVIYRANLKEPATFFHAQQFPMQHGDLVYVSNATAAEWQKFLNIVTSVVYPAVIIQTFIPRG